VLPTWQWTFGNEVESKGGFSSFSHIVYYTDTEVESLFKMHRVRIPRSVDLCNRLIEYLAWRQKEGAADTPQFTIVDFLRKGNQSLVLLYAHTKKMCITVNPSEIDINKGIDSSVPLS
jgi:hypothetical protein